MTKVWHQGESSKGSSRLHDHSIGHHLFFYQDSSCEQDPGSQVGLVSRGSEFGLLCDLGIVDESPVL